MVGRDSAEALKTFGSGSVERFGARGWRDGGRSVDDHAGVGCRSRDAPATGGAQQTHSGCRILRPRVVGRAARQLYGCRLACLKASSRGSRRGTAGRKGEPHGLFASCVQLERVERHVRGAPPSSSAILASRAVGALRRPSPADLTTWMRRWSSTVLLACAVIKAAAAPRTAYAAVAQVELTGARL